MKRSSVMILDGNARAATGVVRSLGGLGVEVIVGSDTGFGRAGYSRYAVRRFCYPSPHVEFRAAHEAILDRVCKWRPDVLFPVYDEGWAVVYSYMEEYKRNTALVPCPSPDLAARVTDKGDLASLAQRYDVPIPATYQAEGREHALSQADSFRYPVLLKPRRGVAGTGIRRIGSPSELAVALQEGTPVPLIQEFIEGEDLELTILCNHGTAVAGSVYLSLRNAPLPYGPPVACRTKRDDGLMQTGRRFLEKLGYHGVAHLDFRRDRKDGVAKLLDFNARLAGTYDISSCSGVDFARLLWQLAIGDNPAPRFAYPEGIEFRWTFGELRHLLQTPHKWSTLGKLLRWKNVHTEISLRDPMPHVAMIAGALRRR
jgi:predicted ATP-grasp superfamily ATP-dependent carboligase